MEIEVYSQEEIGDVRLDAGYYSGYKPKPIEEQLDILSQFFPNLGKANKVIVEGVALSGNIPLPKQAEGWFAIPRWQKIANTYVKALKTVLSLLKRNRSGRFLNYKEGKINQKNFRSITRTERMFENLCRKQDYSDIIIVPAQFGINHRGLSVQQAREIFLPIEFGLNSFAVGIMLLTHPERLISSEDLYIDCAGDEYDMEFATRRYCFAPFFHFLDDKLMFGTFVHSFVHPLFGSVTGFAPQEHVKP